ncbi:MAG: hypothetical protein HOM34_03930 [Planctomycetes bacterium]|jgi:hypothetical protein|nr:hypothetical protein [Planctomycetota bacterium]MBT4027982.1 hypothetical protein [Planctomycetota bacterium]MBT4561128.1 hypothetical protein [Planctomycetota bacterium]MBT5101751.1 hypothetical protein [Planctomycetota bacterium]MBT5119849.1 hypothetical protein [Planctomycetota bacterium]
MTLNNRAFAFTCSLFCSLCLLLVGLPSLAGYEYGGPFLEMAASLYPGFAADGTVLDLLIGVVFAVVDGAFAGWMFAWVYNKAVSRPDGK